MGYMRINCNSCDNFWDINEHNFNNDDANICPVCGEAIERQTYERFIIPAFGLCADASRELKRDITGYNAASFNIDFISYRQNTNASKEILERLDQIASILEDRENREQEAAELLRQIQTANYTDIFEDFNT